MYRIILATPVVLDAKRPLVGQLGLCIIAVGNFIRFVWLKRQCFLVHFKLAGKRCADGATSEPIQSVDQAMVRPNLERAQDVRVM